MTQTPNADYMQVHGATPWRPERSLRPDTDLKSALYSKPVAEVCLNCTRLRCEDRCEQYRTAWKATVKALGHDKYERGKAKCSGSGS